MSQMSIKDLGDLEQIKEKITPVDLKRDELNLPYRVTLVENFYLERDKKQPIHFELRFSRELKTKDQPFERNTVATETFSEIDFGWIKKVGTILIKNEQKIVDQVYPTKEQIEERQKKILLVKFEDSEHGFLIYPEEQIRINPTSSKLLIKSLYEETEYTSLVIAE